MPYPALSTPRQSDFLAIPESPLSYWLSDRLFSLFTKTTLEQYATITQQIITADNNRFLRNQWETVSPSRWLRYVKGGGYCRWFGLEKWSLDWRIDGTCIKLSILEKYPYLKGNWGWLIKAETFFMDGWTYTNIARGSLGIRKLDQKTVCDSKSPTIVLLYPISGIGCILNSHLITFLLRAITPSVDFRESYVLRLPVIEVSSTTLLHYEKICLTLKRHLVAADPTERSFSGVNGDQTELNGVAALLHTLEGVNEREVFAAYGVAGADMQAVLDETGTPAGWFPLVAGYDALPAIPAALDLPPLPQEVRDSLAAHERISPEPGALQRIKANLRALYEAGPGGSVEIDEGESESGDDEAGAASGAHIPIPTETFLEELSVNIELHPISVYWLLEEVRREGARCKPEERRMLEDRLSVLTLRLLGHRWPRQIEVGEAVPTWADQDGIIPMVAGAGQAALAERLRARLRAEDGDVGANRVEGLLAELTGLNLEEWLRREFFKRHVRQFKYRPIAWHLASDPAAAAGGGQRGKGRKRAQPAFECLLYYHATEGDALARIRTQYVEPLLRVERLHLAAARRNSDETTAAQAQARIQELEDFTRRLRDVEEQGFACPDLAGALAGEPLDRWSGDGVLAPAEQSDLERQERAWRVDRNDGVRVNIAPLQLAGLLVSDVLKAADAKKALADRARWRSDERRWVREGKLPRCGWMPDSVPESEAWTKLDPQREAERRKLEAKRRAAVGEVG